MNRFIRWIFAIASGIFLMAIAASALFLGFWIAAASNWGSLGGAFVGLSSILFGGLVCLWVLHVSNSELDRCMSPNDPNRPEEDTRVGFGARLKKSLIETLREAANLAWAFLAATITIVMSVAMFYGVNWGADAVFHLEPISYWPLKGIAFLMILVLNGHLLTVVDRKLRVSELILRGSRDSPGRQH